MESFWCTLATAASQLCNSFNSSSNYSFTVMLKISETIYVIVHHDIHVSLKTATLL